MKILLCLFIILIISPSGYSEEGFLIEAREGLLSVEASGVEFGKIMDEVSRQTGIEISISPDIAMKRLSTSFKDLEIESAIKRMLNLIGQKNYTMHFAEGGRIKKIEIAATTQGTTPQPANAPGAFPMRRAIPPTKSERYKNIYTPQGERPAPPSNAPKGTFEPKKEPSEPITPEPLPPGLPEEEVKALEEMMDEPLKVDNSTDAPYIEPKEKPIYIPPKK